MAKILVAECKQESSSFNPVPSHYQDFSIAVGPELLRRHAGVGSEMAGALGVFATQPDVQIVPAYSARAITSGGVLAAADFDRIAREFLDAVRSAPPVDAVYFSLHGAMEAQNEHDTEGFLLAETRKILGERIPIVVSLDLHGILTDRMLQHADAIAMYHTYPHVDFFQTGERAARLLLRILAGAVRPVTAAVTIPALVRGNELITATGLLGTFVRQAQAIEASPGGLAAGMFIGNPFTDVPGLCSRSVVVTDNDPARAEREAAGAGGGVLGGPRAAAAAPDESRGGGSDRGADGGHHHPDRRRRRHQLRRPRRQQRHPARAGRVRLPQASSSPRWWIPPRSARRSRPVWGTR